MSSDDEGSGGGRMIAWRLERLARVMRAREHEGGMTPAQREALRYLVRANRFSNTPGALTRYLGATKGTVSQTVMALERKGYVAKAERNARKAVHLSLTEKGLSALGNDPWTELAAEAEELGGKTKRRMQRGLEQLLERELTRAGLAGFGVCASCRFFREKGREGDAKGPHLCMLFEDALSDEDACRICIEHAAAI
ncbi:MAG: MarR family transcriptional regulator [Aestuariivirga sp.]|uniref:MarR family winged helix-turn-helix transcriptional regulator n=1 Tax=Aestuariivirga sp. TaxID=2650926 RepID=UPI0025C4F422|nr:MarR family transcriptional regulator [Aestuariivirga sp.]MCA3561185.1 MarR family transcriptional regulator [Aestuariivirga sp.]